MNDRAIVSVDNVMKSFSVDGQSLTAIDEVSFKVYPGEFVCLIGPSGCGKSTLLRILAGLETADRGTIKTKERLRQSMVFQNFAIFPWLTVQENIEFGLKMANYSKEECHHRAQQQITNMNLTGFESKHPRELSGGMKQRVGIARALALEPDILFLDEPFSALDALTAETLRHDLIEIWQKNRMTMVMVTHLVEEAVELADKIIIFSARPGTIKKTVTVNLARPRNLRSDAAYRIIDEVSAQIEK